MDFRRMDSSELDDFYGKNFPIFMEGFLSGHVNLYLEDSYESIENFTTSPDEYEFQRVSVTEITRDEFDDEMVKGWEEYYEYKPVTLAEDFQRSKTLSFAEVMKELQITILEDVIRTESEQQFVDYLKSMIFSDFIIMYEEGRCMKIATARCGDYYYKFQIW